MARDYCYPDSDVLINKFGLKDNASLSKKERMFSGFRLTQLLNKPIVGEFDLSHLQKIHKYIFQDAYDWAGEVRNVNISKGNWFCLYNFIPDESERIFGGIKKEKCLKNLNIDIFSDRLSYYAGEINALHPFREGNGRATREFIRCLANNAEYVIDFSKMNTDELFNAFVKSFSADYRDLKKLFKDSIIHNIENEYKYQFPKDLNVTENLLDNLHKLKLSSKENEYMSLARIKAISDVISENNMDKNPIYKVISDISNELNDSKPKNLNKTLKNDINNDFEL